MLIEKYVLDVKEEHVNTAGKISKNCINKLRSELSSNMFSDYLIDVDVAAKHTEDGTYAQAIVVLHKPSNVTSSALQRGLEEHRFVTGVEWLED